MLRLLDGKNDDHSRLGFRGGANALDCSQKPAEPGISSPGARQPGEPWRYRLDRPWRHRASLRRPVLICNGVGIASNPAARSQTGEFADAGSFQSLHAQGRHAAQPDRDVADDHVPVRRRRDERLPCHADGIARRRRVRPGVPRATGHHAGRPHRHALRRHLRRRADRGAVAGHRHHQGHGRRARRPAWPHRPQRQRAEAVGGQDPAAARPSRWLAGSRPLGDPLWRPLHLPGPCPDGGRDQGAPPQLCPRRAAGAGRRVRVAGDALRPRLPRRQLLLAAGQPAHRRIWRQPGEPPPLPPRGAGRRPRGLARAPAADDAPRLRRLQREGRPVRRRGVGGRRS